MTQGALAEAAGIPLRTLKAWETEKQPDSLPVVLRIADALGVTLDQLAGVPERDDPPPPVPEVVVDGVRYGPISAASSDPGDRPAATPRRTAALGVLGERQPPVIRQRPGSKRRSPNPDEGQR